MNDGFTLRTEGEACFDMSLVNGGANGVAVNLFTAVENGGLLQFDNFNGGGLSQHTCNTILDILAHHPHFSETGFRHIPSGEVVWRPDDRCMYPGPARGFLAFQKNIIQPRVIELLCMSMKKEYAEDSEDQTLCIPSVLFVHEGQKPSREDIPVIVAPDKEWLGLCHLMTEMRRESMGRVRGEKEKLAPLSEALQDSESYFGTTLLPENAARIQSVFGI